MTRARTDLELHVRALVRAARENDDAKMARHCRLLAELARTEGRHGVEEAALVLARHVVQFPPLSPERGEALLRVAFEVAELGRGKHSARRRSRSRKCVDPNKNDGPA
jgi:hypothetical protein